MYSNLKFFDKKGNPLKFSYDSINDKWNGNLYFGIISEELIENLPLYILESVYVNGEDRISIKKPCTSLTGNNWYLEFDTRVKSVTELFFYSFAEDTDGNNYITKTYTQDIILDKFGVTYNLDETKKYVDTSISVDINGEPTTVSQIIQTSPLTVNIAFQPTSENPVQNTLWIKEKSTNKIIAELIVYGEGESEDERLRDLLINLGHDLLPEDSIIFSSSDVKEEFIDWKLINEKRKELLLEYSNLFPYVGSYKALINILKFYGYKNLKMKEYWQNIDSTSADYLKYKQINITDLFTDNADPVISNLIDSKVYKKTNKMSLYYDITVESGEFDDEGLPYTTEVYEFSQEEVLIKLFALKKKLQQYYLPLNSRIVDIIGEAIFFGLYNVSFITSENKIDDIKVGITPTFEIYPTKNWYIQDLRYLGEIQDTGILTNTQIQQVLNSESNNLSDNHVVPVGCPVIFSNTTFDITFEDLRVSYNQLVLTVVSGSTGTNNTWDNLSSFEHLELKWNINLTDSDTKTFNFEKTLSLIEDVTNNKVLGLILPYTGKYDVILTVTDSYNNSTFCIKKGIIEVFSYEADFIGWYKKIDPKYTFETKSIYKRQSDLSNVKEKEIFGEELKWADYTSIWEHPLHPNEPVEIADLTYECLNSINFYENLETDVQDPNIGYFDYSFNSIGLNSVWDDSYHIDWFSAGSRMIEWRLSDFINLSTDYHEIKITSQDNSNTLIVTPLTLSNKTAYLNFLNSLESAGSIFSDFAYFFLEGNQDDPGFDIIAFSKVFNSPNRYNIGYKSSISGSEINKNPYYTNYSGVAGDTPGHFEIYDIVPNEPIEIKLSILINIYDPNFEYSLNYAEEVGTEIPTRFYAYDQYNQSYGGSVYTNDIGYSNLTELYEDITNPTNEYASIAFSKFSIYPVYDKDDNLIKLQFVENSNNYKNYYNMQYSNVIGSDYLLSVNKNVSYNDIRILKYTEQLPILTNIHFCIDNSKIPGKTNPLWVLSKNDDSLFDDIYYRNELFSYTFTQKGSYNLSLYIEDSNGNNNIITKQEIIKII